MAKFTARPLQEAAKETVDANADVIGDKLASTLRTLIKNGVSMKENQELKLQILRVLRDLRTDDKNTKLTAKILKEYHDVADKVQRLKQQALTSKVGAALESNKDIVASREHIATLLEEVRDRKEQQNKMLGSFKGDLHNGLLSFLGPGAPIVHTLISLKREYGDDLKRVTNWLGVEKLKNMMLLKRLDDGSARERSSFRRLMEGTKKAISRLGNALGNSVGGFLGNALNWLKSTRLGGALGKVGGWIGKIFKGSRVGGFLGKAGGLLGKAGGVLGKIGSVGGKLLGPIGAILGLGDIFLNSKNKGKTGEGAFGDYLQGGLSGAALGSFAGPIGTAVGLALGLAATAITRNWDSVKGAMTKGWDKVTSMVKDGWSGLVEFKDSAIVAVGGLWDSLKEKAEKVAKWLSDHLPGFDTIAAPIQQAAADARNAVAAAAASALPAVQNAATWTQENVGGAIGAAAQGVAAFTGKLAQPSEAVGGAISEAAKATGVSESYLLAEAAQESNFNPNAKAGTSSAGGLFQFTDGTWKDMVKKYGAQYGIGLQDKYDAKKNAIMGALYARDNAKFLASKGLATGSTELYAAHMLGMGGAQKLLQAMKENPNASAAAILPEAAKANKNVFYNQDGSAKTVSQVYQFMQDKVGSKATAYAQAKGEGKATAQEQKYDRVPSEKPSADVTVSKKDSNKPTPSGGDTISSGTGINDMPMVVGTTPFLVMQSSMI